MKKFFIIANQSKKDTVEFANEIKEYIELKGGESVLDSCTAGQGMHTDATSVPEDTECVIVLGGDGTILRAAADLADLTVPFLGINLGTLGFLSAAEKCGMKDAIDHMIREDYVVERRMMIFGKTMACGKLADDTRALNDIVITGAKPMQLVNLTVYVNGLLLNKYYADGLIISTPTGSTGYNLSAGGPIINPTAKNMILTPICPHSMHHRSIVLSAEDVIKIVVEPDRYGAKQCATALFDGAHQVDLETGCEITIRRSEKITKIIKLSEEGFLETLHHKLKDD